MNEYFFVNREFNDFSAFADSMRLWNVQMNQLHCGQSAYSVRQLSLERAKLNHLSFYNGHKTSVGDSPQGKTFAFWSGENSELIWRKKTIPQNSVMIYPDGAEHDVMTKGEKVHVYTITIPETIWSSSLSDITYMRCNNISSQEVMSLSRYDMQRLKRVFISYFNLVEGLPEIINQGLFRKEAEDQIILEVKRVLTQALENHSLQPSKKTTQRAWEQIDLTLKKSGNSLLPVNQLCFEAGVSERSLRRLFHDRYGLSPKKFLNRIRLNNVRRQLKKYSYCENNIADIANDHDFWHLGQFAADYRKLFGELPSQTSQMNLWLNK